MISFAYSSFRSLLALLVLGNLFWWTDPASAQNDSEEEYRNAIRIAVIEFQNGNWAEARASFSRAHKIKPNARALRGLGMAAFEMRNYVWAVKDLSAALEDDRNPLNEQQRETVIQLRERAKGYIGRYRISLKPDDAEIEVDGRKATLEDEGVLYLNLGEHEIAVVAPAYEPAKKVVNVVGGEEDELIFELKKSITKKTPSTELPLVPTTRASADDQKRQPEEKKRADNGDESSGLLWTWIALGGTGVFAALAVGFWLDADSKYADAEKSCGNRCEKEVTDPIEASDGVSNLFLVLSVLSAAATVTLFFVERSDDEENEPVSVGIGPGSLTVTGSL